MATWSDDSLRYGLAYYRSHSHDPADPHRALWHEKYADRIYAEMLARKLRE